MVTFSLWQVLYGINITFPLKTKVFKKKITIQFMKNKITNSTIVYCEHGSRMRELGETMWLRLKLDPEGVHRS